MTDKERLIFLEETVKKHGEFIKTLIASVNSLYNIVRAQREIDDTFRKMLEGK